MTDKDNPNGTATATTLSSATTGVAQIDNRLRFSDGRIWITHIPYYGNGKSGLPERIDVTEQVAQAISQYITPQETERQRYIIRLNLDYLNMVYLQSGIDTWQEKSEMNGKIIRELSNFIEGKGPDKAVCIEFTGSDGKRHRAWTLDQVQEGDPLLAVIEDVNGNELQRVVLKEEEKEED